MVHAPTIKVYAIHIPNSACVRMVSVSSRVVACFGCTTAQQPVCASKIQGTNAAMGTVSVLPIEVCAPKMAGACAEVNCVLKMANAKSIQCT